MATAMMHSGVHQLLEAGLAQHRAGRLADAEACYLQAVAMDRKSADGWHLLGVCQHDRGHFEEAERSLRTALRLRPAFAAALVSSGNVQRELGRLDEAIACYQRATALDSKLGLAHYNLGTALEQASRYDEALASYEVVLRLGRHPIALAARGNCLLRLGRHGEAVGAYQQALELDPQLDDACANMALALHALGRGDEAVQALQAVLGRNPAHEPANRALVAVLDAQDRLGDAVVALEALCASHPQDAGLLLLRARALSGALRIAEAADSFARYVELRPEDSGARGDLATHLGLLGRFDAAIANCETALSREPDDPDLRLTRAFLAYQSGDRVLARNLYQEILERRPDVRLVQMHLGLLELLEGNYASGWRLYEDRWSDSTAWGPGRRRSNLLPWLGEPDLQARTLLVYSEQGLGDTLHFSRYVPLVARRAGRVIFEVPGAALSLLQRCMPANVSLLPHGAEFPPADLACALSSLPLAFGTELADIPAPTPGLAADPERVRLWSARLGLGTVPDAIGLAWSGNPRHKLDTQRSLPLAAFASLVAAHPQRRFLALQTELSEADRDVLAGLPNLIFAGTAVRDLDDTAALVACCERVISVDTVAAHLAGTLGKPLWLLLQYVPDWRWLLDRDDSPWYATARLFRQHRLGAWDEPLARIEAALRETGT